MNELVVADVNLARDTFIFNVVGPAAIFIELRTVINKSA